MQSSLALCICLFIAVSCAAYTEREYQGAFAAWQQQHQRAYTVSDFAHRYAVFKNTMDFISAHNSGDHSFTLGLNHLSDLTNAEYRSLLYPIDDIPASANLAVHMPDAHSERTPASVDWRTSGAVQVIKNQGQCGSCWTFATAASIESITKIATGTLPNLSEQNLLDCTPNGNSGCGGGVPYYATQYVQSNGIDTEAAYPYQTAKGSCRANSANKVASATVSSIVSVSKGSESALQSAVAQQPVSIAIDASLSTFQSYKSGVYNDASCSSTNLDHAVLAVGYGTDSSQGDYWIVKNSWGTYWGQQGYFWLARNANNKCGVATNAIYPKH